MVKFKSIIKVINDYIIKTHDGTSMSLIKPLQKEFAEKHKNIKTHEAVIFWDNEGNELNYIKGKIDKNNPKSSYRVTVREYLNQLKDSDYYDLHADHNHHSHYLYGIPTYLTCSDMYKLLIKNKNDKHVFRSISAEAPNGSRMTIIRGNKFNANTDELFYLNTINKIDKACSNYYGLYVSQVFSDTDKEQNRNTKLNINYNYNSLHKKSVEKFVKENGTLEHYLKSQGLYDDLAKINCKIRIKQPNGW